MSADKVAGTVPHSTRNLDGVADTHGVAVPCTRQRHRPREKQVSPPARPSLSRALSCSLSFSPEDRKANLVRTLAQGILCTAGVGRGRRAHTYRRHSPPRERTATHRRASGHGGMPNKLRTEPGEPWRRMASHGVAWRGVAWRGVARQGLVSTRSMCTSATQHASTGARTSGRK